MALEDIEKLKMRVERDPHSRLFLPLAEEYRRSGMVDEAVAVLLRGLALHPSYTSARVALGRLYLEKNMMYEARAEFEKVINTVPDNLFAHRKLADIYRDLGEIEKAISEYGVVLNLNPRDEEAKSCLETIEEGRETEATPLSEHLGGEIPEIESTVEPIIEISEELLSLPAEVSGEPHLEDIFEADEFHEGYDAFWGTVDISSCDSLVARGDYYKAMEAYRITLTGDPGNRHVIQRIAELKAFLKLMGRGEEVLIARLEAFLEGIRKGFSQKPSDSVD